MLLAVAAAFAAGCPSKIVGACAAKTGMGSKKKTIGRRRNTDLIV